MVFQDSMTLEKKLEILADAAKYDVACTSSGVQREGKKGSIGNSCAAGICHSFAADGRCISLLKVLYTNECTFDCKYCINRSSNDVPRASFTPEELCRLTIEFYRRNYIEGLFLSSGILISPNYTMEQIIITLRLLRNEYRFNGYIHCKTIPGASPDLIELAGWYADRMSINLELPTAGSLKELAPHKSRKTILAPIRQIQNGIDESQLLLGMNGGNKGRYWYTKQHLQGNWNPKVGQDRLTGKDRARLTEERKKGEGIFASDVDRDCGKEALMSSDVGNKGSIAMGHADSGSSALMNAGWDDCTNENKGARVESEFKPPSPVGGGLQWLSEFKNERGFVPAGQSTQMIIGATPESDFQIVSVAEALYQRFDLKRVFYSAYINMNQDLNLPAVQGKPPLLREHRLYQADWLLRYYGFSANELLSEKQPNFNVFIDPKCNWALGHMELFPVEVNKADYFTLLRVPGIGTKSAGRILQARKMSKLGFDDLKRLGVVLKRAVYFITCSGKLMYPLKMEEDFITRQLVGLDKNSVMGLLTPDITYRQLSLFDDKSFTSSNMQLTAYS